MFIGESWQARRAGIIAAVVLLAVAIPVFFSSFTGFAVYSVTEEGADGDG